MVVLHDLIHSSGVRQDSCSRSSSIFLLASQSAINSPYSFGSGVLHFFVLLRYASIWLWHNFTSSLEMLPISPQQAYSFVVDFLNNSVQSFLLSSFHSTHSILSEALRCSSHQVPSHLVKFIFYSFHFQSECCSNSFIHSFFILF